MKRRIQGVFLIAVLLSGHPLQPVGAGCTLSVRVRIGPVASQGAQGVRREVAAALEGLAGRVVVAGRCLHVELSAKSPQQLVAALSRLAAAAGEADLECRVFASGVHELRALAAKSPSLDPPRQAGRQPVAALPGPPRQHRSVPAICPEGPDPPTIQSAGVIVACAPRAPPR